MTNDKCKPCDIAVTGIMTHIDGLIEKTNALRDMEMFKQDEIEIHGFTYTKQELLHKIERHKRWIKENHHRYGECCNTGILPAPKISD